MSEYAGPALPPEGDGSGQTAAGAPLVVSASAPTPDTAPVVPVAGAVEEVVLVEPDSPVLQPSREQLLSQVRDSNWLLRYGRADTPTGSIA